MPKPESQYDLATNPQTISGSSRPRPNWLGLPPHGEHGRFAFGQNVLDTILARYPGAKMTFFDTEAFTADCSDVMVWTRDESR